jgi:peptidoglycan/LPS O-acetylase OafA/YrhL
MGNEIISRYRADIDGLRAIAVSAVVLFHAGVPGFGGGFTGVDIFFVISGYLITALILPDIDARCFSITAFYQRRIRRIFPALIVVIAFCIAVGYFLLAPSDYQTFGQSVVATGAFVSNIFFWQKTSYFGAPASENPLLHTWSLSIEEQFYLFYPMFLVLISKGSRNMRTAAVLSVCLISFIACVGLIFYKPSATFFLGPTRAWELLVGGIIALGLIPRCEHRAFNLAASLVGLICIIYGIVFYSSSVRYPGYAALAPVVGAALLIWSGQTEKKATVHQFLATAPFVALGQASYSLYLWHFPLFAYFEYATLGKIGSGTTAEVCAFSLIAAFLSLRLIERPFRFPAQRAAVPRLVMMAVFAMAALVGVGAYIQVSGGVPSRMDAVSAKYLNAELDKYRHHQECMSLENKIVRPADACKFGAVGVRPTALLWGDSHAMVTATALEHAALENNAAFLFAASVDCPIGIGFSIDPKIGPAFVATPGYQYCEKYNSGMLQVAIDNPDIKSVVLSSRWTNWHVGESGSPSEAEVDIRLRDVTGVAGSLEANKAIFIRGFDRLLHSLISAGKTVWIVGPVPEASVRVPKALYIKHIGFDTTDIDIPTALFWRKNKTVFSIFSDMAGKYPVKFIWPQQVLCDDAKCPVSEDGSALYLDDNHLSVFGALKTAPLYDTVFFTSHNSTSSRTDRFQPKAADTVKP